MSARSLGHRAPLLWIVLPFMAGIIAGRIGHLPSTAVLFAVGSGAAITTLIATWRRAGYWAPSIVGAMFCAGAASYGVDRARLALWDSLPAREVEVTIRIDRIFGRADPRKSSGLGRITATDRLLRELTGQRVYVSTLQRPGDPMPSRSAILTVVGVLAPLPKDPPVNSFAGYLAGNGINFRLTRARIVGVVRPQLGYYRFCDAAARRFNEILGLGISQKRPALAGLLRAMMLGETRELTEDQHTIFMQSGTMHLFAISGLNIGVIAGALQALLKLARLPAWTRFIVGAPLLWLFVDITGASPSAIRACIMAIFFQGAFVLRRPANPLAAIVASAAVVLVAQPLQLFSASFLMSYAIVAALLTLGLPLGEAWLEGWSPWRQVPPSTWTRWQRWTDRSWRWTAPTLAIGVATTLVSLLTSVQFFELLTPGALFANLVLIPAAMVVTLGGFGALMCGLLGFTVGTIVCNHASALVLLGIETLVRTSVRLPGAFVGAHFKATWIGPTALGALVAALFVGYGAGWRREGGGWWPPFAIVAATLVFGLTLG